MKVDVSNVPEWGLEVDVELDAREIDLADAGADLAGDVHLKGRVLKAGDEILLEGTLRAAFNLNCSRCLKNFVKPFEFDISATYAQTSGDRPDGRAETALDEDTRIMLLDDEIDLLSGIREDVVLNIPVKPLCSEDCRGLCIQCGTDLNEGECTCRKEDVDLRFAPLSDIRTQLERQVKKQNRA
jgi:uncharacterized protein